VFGLDDGATLWESISMGSGFSGMVGVMVLQSDADPAPELVAVLPGGLRAFDAATQLLEWTATLEEGISTAAYDPLAAQFVLGRNGTVTVHDAVTRSVVRTIASEGQITALAALPGSQRWLAYDENHLLVIDGASDNWLGRTPWLGPPLPGGQLAVVPDGTDWLVASTNQVGLFMHRIEPSHVVFANGFEP
jgi:hypothetical protein